MRLTSVLVGLVCLIAALSFTVWVGGSGPQATTTPRTATTPDPVPPADAVPPHVAKVGPNAAKGHDHDHDHGDAAHDHADKEPEKGDRTEEPDPVISKTGPYPKAHVEEANFDFGATEPETPGEHIFKIRNDGDAPLILRRGTSTCQCTRFDILKSEVPPGETADILVSWVPKSGSRQFGQSLNVKTNDPKQSIVKLSVGGLVESKLVLMPTDPWNIGTFAGKEDSNPKYGSITSRMVDNLKIESVEAEHPELVTVNITPLAPDDELIVKEKNLSGAKIEVILHPNIPIGSINEQITLHTNVPKFETLSFNIQGHRSGPIRIYPTQGVRFNPEKMLISMGQFPSQDGKKVELRMIVNELDQDFQISELEIDPATLKMTIEKDPTNFDDPSRRRYLLTFEVPPNGPSQARTFDNIAKIKFLTNHPQMKEMTFYLDYIAL